MTEIDNKNEIISTSALCFNCEREGTATLCVISVPFFDDVFASSFFCEHCGYKDNKIECLKAPADFGIHIELKIINKNDLDRILVKQNSCLICIPEIEFEFLPFKSQGSVISLELFLRHCIDNLFVIIKQRAQEIDLCNKLMETVDKIENLLEVKNKFTIILDDPSGNSHIQNLVHPEKDPNLWVLRYKRTWSENELLGLERMQTVEMEEFEDDGQTLEELESKKDDQVMCFPENCPMCHKIGEIRMQNADIPHFEGQLLTCFSCTYCGHRKASLMNTASIKETGIRYILNVSNREDLNREMIKSDNCFSKIAELELELGPEVVAGVFTTVEGFLDMLKDSIQKTILTASETISLQSHEREKFEKIIESLDKMISGEMAFTLSLDDPTGNSYLQDVMAPDLDPHLTIERYKRSIEQNEQLCIEE